MPKPSFWSNLQRRMGTTPQRGRRQASIYRSLPAGMTLVVAVTVLIGGFSATGLIWWQLEQQVQLRVLGTQSSTLALYSTEQSNIQRLVLLISERPTLCALLENNHAQELSSYLERLQKHTTVDFLAVVTATGQRISSNSLEVPSEAILEPPEMPYADFVVLQNPPRLAIVGVSAITPAQGCDAALPGRVIAIQVLDHDFMQSLAENTGLQQSLIIDGRRVETSFFNGETLPLNPDAAFQVLRTREACCTVGSSGKETYYVGLAPLLDKEGRVVALSEVALYANTIRSGVWKAIAIILGISVLAALIGGALTFPLSRRITDPLYRLSDAAERMSSGDLETPIPVSSGWVTIDRLASQLEHARKNLRQTQQITRRELNRIVHLLGAIREGVVTINVEGDLTWANTDACQILGYDVLDLLRKNYQQIFRPAPGQPATLEHVISPRLGRPVPDHITILNSKGSEITLSVAHSLVNGDPDDPRHALNEHILIIRDVSEEQAINRLRSEFLANLAHEFRTPLSAISASTELLADEGDDMNSEELAHLAHTIQLSTVHLQNLVNNLLESAIIEAGLFRLRYCSILLTELLGNVTEIMSPLLQQRQQQLKVNAPEGFPCFWGDPDRLKQALVNLIENASKFSPAKAVIQLSVQPDTKTISFIVSDAGPGLPMGRFGDLFNRFVTGDRPHGAKYGIGLGLPIVKAIAEAHGGRVAAENRLKGGASVSFMIPFTEPVTGGETNDQNPGGR